MIWRCEYCGSSELVGYGYKEANSSTTAEYWKCKSCGHIGDYLSDIAEWVEEEEENDI